MTVTPTQTLDVVIIRLHTITFAAAKALASLHCSLGAAANSLNSRHKRMLA
jgi:hypothetical protein